jgi:hypothetical protein
MQADAEHQQHHADLRQSRGDACVGDEASRGRTNDDPREQLADPRQRAAAGEQKAKLAREFGISCETLYQYLRTDD